MSDKKKSGFGDLMVLAGFVLLAIYLYKMAGK